MKYFLMVLVLTSASLMACYYDNEQDLYPSTSNNVIPCDTTNLTYTTSILPIMTAQCTRCHSASKYVTDGGNIRLDSYSDVQIYANNGRIVGAITHSPGYTAMPDNTAALSACDIEYFKHWIAIGMPN